MKKVFKEIRKPHALAANASADTDSVTRCSKYMWAVMQVHLVMQSFQDQCFCYHPSIAPVINLHVFKTRVTKMAFEKEKGQQTKLDQRCNMLDSLHTWLTKLEKQSHDGARGWMTSWHTLEKNEAPRMNPMGERKGNL